MGTQGLVAPWSIFENLQVEVAAHVTACSKLRFCLHPTGPPASLILVPPSHLLSVDPAESTLFGATLCCWICGRTPSKREPGSLPVPIPAHVGLLQGVTFALGIPDGLAETSYWLRMLLPNPPSYRFSLFGCRTQTVHRRFSPGPSHGVIPCTSLARLIFQLASVSHGT